MHPTSRGRQASRRRRRKKRLWPSRECVRKGCGRSYRPKRANQLYCQDPDCLRLVKRWSARVRQARWRQVPEVAERRRQAEKARRLRQVGSSRRRPVRGDAGGARRGGPICARTGCFDRPVASPRVESRYSGEPCRRVMRRVRDRARKYRLRRLARSRARSGLSTACRRGVAHSETACGGRHDPQPSSARSAESGVAPSTPIDPPTGGPYAPAVNGRGSDGRDGSQAAGRSKTRPDAEDGGDALRLDGRTRPP